LTKITSALEPPPPSEVSTVGPEGVKELAAFLAGTSTGSGLSGTDISIDDQLAALPPTIVLSPQAIDASILEELANRSETGACQAMVALHDAMVQIHGMIGTGAPITWADGNFGASLNGITKPIVIDLLDRCPELEFAGIEGLREATQLAAVVIGTVVLTLGVGTVAAGIGGATGTAIQTVGDIAQTQLTGLLVPDAPPVALEEPTTAQRFAKPALVAAGIILAAVLLR